MRSLLVVIAAAVVVLFQQGCGAKPTCGPSTCQGCCAADGQCVTATTASACGSSGSACITCNVGSACVLGACSSGTGGGGGGTGGGGGATGGGGGATGGGGGATGGGGGATGGGGGGSTGRYPDGGSRYAYWDGGACTVKTDCPCFSSDDCGPGFSCQSEDSSGLNVFCKPGARGDGGVGASCAVEGDCDSALCTDSNAGMFCSALCSGNADCPSVLPSCTFIGFGIDRAICSPP